MSLPSLYKQRGLPLKQAVCAICADRTNGPTQLVRLTHGVSLWLCPGHASHEFRSRRSGRDFVVTMQRIWHANGCLTTQRRRALDAQLAALRGAQARPRPGSYAWPAIRREVEQRLARGATLTPLIGEIRMRLAKGPPDHPARRHFAAGSASNAGSPERRRCPAPAVEQGPTTTSAPSRAPAGRRRRARRARCHRPGRATSEVDAWRLPRRDVSRQGDAREFTA